MVFSNPAPPQRFGALNMTAVLGPFIMRHPEVKHNMSQFMMQHVLPQFSSSEGFLRAIVSHKIVNYVMHIIIYNCLFKGLRGPWGC